MKINKFGCILIVFVSYIFFKLIQESFLFNLKCINSDIDGKKYCVRERDNMSHAADRLATINVKMQKLVKHCIDKYPKKSNMIRLSKGYNPKKIYETLPTSKHTAYSENKGEKLAFCLNDEKHDNNKLVNPNTLMFVAIHELAHIATLSIGHNDEFWKNFKFLLEEAEKIGIYKQIDYKKNPVNYCGSKIADNPYYDY